MTMRLLPRKAKSVPLFDCFENDEKGSQAVEIALLLPFLLLLGFGVLEASNLYYVKSNLYSAVREAARRGAAEAQTTEEVASLIESRMQGVTRATISILYQETTKLLTPGRQILVAARIPIAEATITKIFSGVLYHVSEEEEDQERATASDDSPAMEASVKLVQEKDSWSAYSEMAISAQVEMEGF